MVTAFAAQKETGKVVIGAYINGINSIDLKAGTVNLDVYLWLLTKGDRNLLDSIEVMNGTVEEKSSIVAKKIGDDNYFSVRMQIKTLQLYDLRAFPLDKQHLILYIEDSQEDISGLEFVADTANTKTAGSISLPGWKVGKVQIKTVNNKYDTNYGDKTWGSDSSSFSRTVIDIPIQREGFGYFFKLFCTVFLSAAVAFLAFHILPGNMEPRFGLGVGGIFAVVASDYVLASMLPETHQITMGEGLLILTMVFIFITLIEIVYTVKLWEDGKQAISLKINRICGIVIPISYVVLSVIIILSHSFIA